MKLAVQLGSVATRGAILVGEGAEGAGAGRGALVDMGAATMATELEEVEVMEAGYQ